MSEDFGRNTLLLNENSLTILKAAFYYGCYTVNEFKNLGISSSTYGRCKDFLLQVFNDCIEEIPVPQSRRTMLRIKNNQFENSHNLLLDLYSYKRLNKREVVLFLLALNKFAGKSLEEACMVREFTADFEAAFSGKGGKEILTTLRQKLSELCDMGYLHRRKKNNRDYEYHSVPMLFNVLDEKELFRLNALVDLCKNIYHPAACGRYLMDSLAFFNTQKSIEYKTIFFCKHLHMGQVLYDAVLWKLMTAIYEKKIICFTVNGKKLQFQQPHKIIINESDGRRYLYSIGLDTYTKKGKLHRIDQITGIKEEKQTDGITMFSTEYADQCYYNSIQRSFNGISMPHSKIETAVLVYKKASYPEIRKHFPDTAPEAYDDLHDQVQISVNSLNDLKPWLRLHLGEIQLFSASNNVKDEFEKELTEWRAMYGIV